MSDKTFYQFFALTSITAIIMTVLLAQLDNIQNHIGFLSTTIACFMIFTYWAYFMGKRNAALTDKYVFSRFFLKSIAFKFLLTILLLVIYTLGFHPENKDFGIPFIIIYLLFSFCENYALIKLSKPTVLKK